MKDVFATVLGFVAPFVLVVILGYFMYQGGRAVYTASAKMKATHRYNADSCQKQTSEFEYQVVNGILYCSDNGKWVKLEKI